MGDGGEAHQEFSSAWKGWTNGGGERASTAAQFSRFGENGFATPSLALGATAPGASRVTTPVPMMPATPTATTPEAAAFSPIHAALERLISRSQDSLSVTVRFEQGGSLSLKLSMSDGGIKTHIHTDVPGLDTILRSGWDSFAQDWNQRGVKLGSLTIGHNGSSAIGEQGGGREHAGQHSADRHQAGAEGQANGFGFPGIRRSGTGRGSRPGGAQHHPSPDVAAAASRLPRGFRTWA